MSSPKEVHEGFVCWKRGHLLSRLAHHSDDFAHGLVRSILVSNDQLHQTCHRQLLDFCALESTRGHEVHFSNSLLRPLCSPSSYSSRSRGELVLPIPRRCADPCCTVELSVAVEGQPPVVLRLARYVVRATILHAPLCQMVELSQLLKKL